MQGGHALQTPAEAPADAVLESTGDTIWSGDSAVQPQPNPSTIFASAESAPLQSQPVEGLPQPVARQPRDQQAALDCICAISRLGGGRAAVHRRSAAVPLRAPSGAAAGDPTAPQADQFCFFILMRSYPFQCIACEFRREARKYSRGRHPAPRVDRVAWELVQHGRGGRIGLSHLRGARRGGGAGAQAAVRAAQTAAAQTAQTALCGPAPGGAPYGAQQEVLCLFVPVGQAG